MSSYFSNLSVTNEEGKNTSNRTVFDAVHGHIELEGYLWDFIDTEEFQRLRNLKQLGNAHMVYPGATHSRFEHSLGTSYLSSQLVNILTDKLPKEHYPSGMEKKSVALAGLLHDLGHGPFSHLFDRMVIKTLQ